MLTAASNRHCQIQGTVVASLEDGPFWIYTHIQNKKNTFKKSTKKKKPKLTTLPGKALVTQPVPPSLSAQGTGARKSEEWRPAPL